MYDTMINPFSVTLTFAGVLILLGLFKPQAARIIFGIFFLIMALGVNIPVILTDPNLFVAAGANALLPIYRWFFTSVLAWNPVLFAIPLVIFETTVGVLLLSKGKYVKYGLIGAALFCLFIAPVGIEEIMCPSLSLAALLLLRRTFDRSLVDLMGWRLKTA